MEFESSSKGLRRHGSWDHKVNEDLCFQCHLSLKYTLQSSLSTLVFPTHYKSIDLRCCCFCCCWWCCSLIAPHSTIWAFALKLNMYPHEQGWTASEWQDFWTLEFEGLDISWMYAVCEFVFCKSLCCCLQLKPFRLCRVLVFLFATSNIKNHFKTKNKPANKRTWLLKRENERRKPQVIGKEYIYSGGLCQDRYCAIRVKSSTLEAFCYFSCTRKWTFICSLRH